MSRHDEPVGVVLAGGLGRRIGGSKALVKLNRRPLISYPLEAVWRALGNVAIVAKIDTKLPSLPGVAIWIEPDEPRHPLTGIVHALLMSEGRAVLVCAGDMPLVSAELVCAIACADPGRAPAVVASAGGALQPMLGCYHPAALELLAGAESGIPLRDAVAAICPATYEVTDPNALFNVNSPADLLQASAMLRPVDGPRSRPATRT